MNNQVLELIGLPAVGKSTYAKELEISEGFSQIIINSRSERFIRSLLYAVRHPRIAFTLLHLTGSQYTKSKHPLIKHKIFYLLLGALAKEQKSKFYKRSVIDEGIFQYLLSLYEQKVDTEAMRSDLVFLKNAQRGILVLTADKTIRETRMQRRGRRFRSGTKNTNYLSSFESVIENNIESLERTLTYFKFNIKRVDTSNCKPNHNHQYAE